MRKGSDTPDAYEPPEQFKSIITSTVTKLQRAADPAFDAADGWELIKNKNGVNMHKKKAEKVKGERAITTVRGVGLVRCDALTYRDLCIDLGQRRKMWDPVFSEGKVVELVDECTAVIWMELRSKKCVIEVHRDVLYMQHSRRLANGTVVVASRSAGVLQTMVPVPEGAVRATLHASGYVIRPLQDELGTCEVTYVVQLDTGGPIPTAILNRIAEDLPQCIARQRTVYAELYGGGGNRVSEAAVDGAAATETSDDFEEMPESGDMLQELSSGSSLRPQFTKSHSVVTPIRMGGVRGDSGSLGASADALPSPRSPKSSPRIGVRQSSCVAEYVSPRQVEQPDLSPRSQSAHLSKALPQLPPSPRNSRQPEVAVSPRGTRSVPPEGPAPTSPRPNRDVSPRQVRVPPPEGTASAPPPLASSPRSVRQPPTVPPIAVSAAQSRGSSSPMPSPRMSPVPSPRSSDASKGPTPAPRRN